MNDLRYAIRMLLKQPGFSAVAVLTLALGIGATAAVFSLIQGVLLTPPPYREPERLVLVPPARADGQKLSEARGWPAAQWLGWQKEARSFEAIAAYDWTFNFLILPQGSESLEGMAVTVDYFRAAGIQPVMGRIFQESEATSSSSPVILIGYELWQRKFQGDPNILGKTMRMSRRDTPPRIIGVMPAGVRFLPTPAAAQEPNYNVNATVDFWTPAAPDPARLKDARWNVVGRLRTGVTLSRAQAELALISQRQAQADHDFQGIQPRLKTLSDEINRDGNRILYPLLGAAALVLLIACGNAAALLLVRGLQRQQEYAVRTALGVARMALFRHVAAESLLLGLLGGMFGMGLAYGVVRIFRVIGGHAIPRLDAVKTGWPVLAWGLGAALLAALLAGLLPALRASGLDPATVLRSAGPKTSAGRAERRLLRAVTMFQTALTLALLVGAGLLVRTMVNLSNVPTGYDTRHILTMTVTAVQGDWADFHHRALAKVSALPGVRDAAFAWGVPLTGNNWPGNVEIEGQAAAANASDQISLPLRSVTPGYFQLLGLALAEGRDIRATDDRKAPPIAVVNQALAERYFPGASPVGRKLWLNGRQRPATEIVGVVRNGRTADLTRAAEPEVYLSLWQASAFSKDLVIRTAADPRPLIPVIERALRSVDPTAAAENVKTLEQIRGDSVASRAFAMQLLVGFSLIGSVLSLVGIYGVLSLSVASRRRELAIRAAVGAGAREIRALIFAEGLRLIAGGVLSGLLAAIVLSRVLQAFLFGVGATDPATLIGVGLLFAAVALLACFAPGRRAAQVNPMDALRCD
ncbi:MAG: ADOP family duplicated permease [Acidobacteriota bacterium]